MKKTIWTVGHSTLPIEEFIGRLRAHQIGAVADVRRFAASRRHPQFGQQRLAEALALANIEYHHFVELGGRRTAQPQSPNTAWRNAAFRGYADYMMTAAFRAGVQRLLELAGQTPTAIMCAEVLWWRCHRALVADYLKAGGHLVMHIRGSGGIQEHPFTSAAHLVGGKLSYHVPESEPEFVFESA